MLLLSRNNTDMTNAALSRDWRTFRIYTWVNNSRTTFRTIFSMLNWQAAERPSVVGTWNGSITIDAYLCLLDQSCFKFWQQLGISASCCFHVIFMSNLSGLVFPQCKQFQQYPVLCQARFSQKTKHRFKLNNYRLFNWLVCTNLHVRFSNYIR